jgi:hypothetical protein
MWNKPSREELAKIPRLYTSENKSWQDKLIYMHFFIGGCHWYVAEYDTKEGVFFGYAILNNDLENSEWGYVSLDELLDINIHGIEVDRDLYWTPRKALEVDRIFHAYQQQNCL